MSLTFGKSNSWTSSNFVLLDGEMAQYQNKISFHSVPSVIFGWLIDRLEIVNLGHGTSSTGILIVNSDSDVELYYNYREIPGSKFSSKLNFIYGSTRLVP